MAQAKSGNTVKVHYTGKFEDGMVFDSSVNREPLEFTLGEGRVIPGFEQAVIGMNPGESKTFKIQADNAYGPHHKEMVVMVERNQLPVDLEPKVGQQLKIRKQDGETIIVTVTNVSESEVTLDANHPLAGKDLIFDIRLIDVA